MSWLKGKAMTPSQSGRVLLALRILNILLAISVILLGFKLSTAFFSKSQVIGDFPIKKGERTTVHKPTLNELRPCWQTQFWLKSQAKSHSKANPEQKKQINPSQIPFKLIACSVHSDLEKSCAFVLDEQKNQQILVRIGENIGQTQYRVANITENKVELESKDCTVTLEKPQPWLCMVNTTKDQKDKSQSPSKIVKPEKSQDVIEDNQRITILNAAPFTKYGFKQHDQIIAIGDERISKIDELEKLAQANKQATTQLVILRQGRFITLNVPSEFFYSLR